jgi:tetratricopeptide (TPR) repeat protein
MSDNPRIEELRRRVQMDPASIAFAALAEEYRRAGRFDEAVATCEAGLTRHPAYLSARVTLGRALMELSRYDEARAQLEQVLRVAPENLAAIRALAEIHTRAVSDHTLDPAHLAEAHAAEAQAAETHAAETHAADAAPQSAAPEAAPPPPSVPPAPAPIPIRLASVVAPPEKPVVPALAGLESFLAAILRAREELGSRTTIR